MINEFGAAKKWFLERRGRDGFSLPEALIAIAIAALLAAALTRLAGNTRMNAVKIRQFVEMMTLNETLLGQTGVQKAGITEGRTGDLAWRIIVEPIEFSALPRYVAEKRSDESGALVNGVGFAVKGVNRPTGKAPMTQETPQWTPLHVTIVVQSRSGYRYTSDTIKLGVVTRDQ